MKSIEGIPIFIASRISWQDFRCCTEYLQISAYSDGADNRWDRFAILSWTETMTEILRVFGIDFPYPIDDTELALYWFSQLCLCKFRIRRPNRDLEISLRDLETSVDFMKDDAKSPVVLVFKECICMSSTWILSTCLPKLRSLSKYKCLPVMKLEFPAITYPG